MVYCIIETAIEPYKILKVKIINSTNSDYDYINTPFIRFPDSEEKQKLGLAPLVEWQTHNTQNVAPQGILVRVQ